ncbi:hypothetical protein BGZ80_001529 [Entomortierella chlamydospora]|uniref:Mfs transporter n=1 Tax=Entomortierella chlamydospora TaxID=101097 RepID=A0A9P6N389_9FUNG|nr:hypothetical protein BGZ79_005553 [Entomortierella chlamydospora]KAG0021887.1 hypothetical protein BGZ80_001529 [Entomortierella chlamydospora]
MTLSRPKQFGFQSVSTSARAASFIAACAVALVSGTPYLYSTYANQLTTKLALTALQSNVVAAGVHYGLFLSGPLFGRLVDSRGPKFVGTFAAGLLATGYSGLAVTYSGFFYSFGFLTAFLFLILVGMGSQAGYMTAVSTNAHNFHSARGLAMSIPIALFGLSALLFAQINNLFYKDDTQAFMFLVAKAIGGTILISVLFLTVFPKDDQKSSLDPEAVIATANQLGSDEIISHDAEEHRRNVGERERLLQTTPTSYSNIPSTEPVVVHHPLSGFKLFATTRVAMTLFISILLLAGPGLMYMTNAGNVIRSIYRDHMEDPSIPPTDEELIRLQQLQNYHVSLISLCSCLGRFSVGMMSDLGKRGSGKWWGISRIGFLVYAGVCVWLGQTFGANINDINDLAKVSILVGLGYGSVFGVAPTIVSEWFGVSFFGTNWGWISIGNAIGGQFFNVIFGYLYDLEAQQEHTLECFGTECFHTSFVLGTVSSFLGVGLLIYLAITTRRT